MFKVCERSLSGTGGGPNAAAAHQFVRAEMLPSGYLVRPCEGGGSIVHIVDHLDLEVYMQKSYSVDILLSFLHVVFHTVNHFPLFFSCRHGVCQKCSDHFMSHPVWLHKR
jgi:START domain